MSNQPLVYIVILNWNGLQDTLACLASVYASEYHNYKCLVIDNNSVNDELSLIKDRYPEVIGMQSQTNLGFTGGCNLGIERSLTKKADYVWLLNNDAKVFPGTLSSMIKQMQYDSSIGMVSPVIYDYEYNGIVTCGIRIQPDTLRAKNLKSIDEYLEVERETPFEICLWGTALLIRTQMIEQVGLFDDRYFAYFEDTDLCVRAISNSWRNLVDIHSRVLHGEVPGVMTRHKYYYMARNELLFLMKHSPHEYLKRNIGTYVARVIRRAAGLRDKCEIENSKIVLDGIWHAYNNIYGEWKNHKRTPSFLANLILSHPYFLSGIMSVFN